MEEREQKRSAALAGVREGTEAELWWLAGASGTFCFHILNRNSDPRTRQMYRICAWAWCASHVAINRSAYDTSRLQGSDDVEVRNVMMLVRSRVRQRAVSAERSGYF